MPHTPPFGPFWGYSRTLPQGAELLVGGWGGGSKMLNKRPPPFFGSKIMNLLVFFDFEPKNGFRVRTPWGLYGAEWDER